jgi:putative tricarboxylic transport membrane protein
MPVYEAAWQGFLLVFSWPNIIYPTIATMLAMVFAFLPGLSGVTLMALAISLTYAWDPLYILLIFGAFTGGATFMGSITAILFNIPGTAPSAASMIDGHPLAMQGKARTAIACSATASALGSSIGVVILVASLPVLRRFILAFGPAEFLILAVWGLSTIAVLTGKAVFKGLAAAGIGLLLASIGFHRSTAELRFTFSSIELQEGVSVIPVFLGLFAVAEIISLMASGRQTIAAGAQLSGSLREGIEAVFRHPGLLLRSSVIGTGIGMLPAAGGTVASFLAYGHAVQSARDRSRFGHGDLRGVLAPEAAHDAKDGGSLAPTLAFGIPGNEGTAVLLAALTLHGFSPGRDLLTDRLPMAFVLIWSLFYSNWLTSILGVMMAGPLARLSVVRTARLAPFVLVLAVVGAFAYRGRFSDVMVALGFGIAGYFMKKYGWPVVALVTALVLGPMFEQNLQLTVSLHEAGRINFFTRPLVWILAASMVAMFAFPGVRSLRQRSERAVGDRSRK